MEEILRLLEKSSAFYIATIEVDKARVRPFGFAMIFDGRLYFCTGNHKNVYKQLDTNPNFELCTVTSGGEWLRVSGKAVFDRDMKAKEHAFAVSPSLEGIYGSAKNPNFEVFYIIDGEATIYSFSEPPKSIKF